MSKIKMFAGFFITFQAVCFLVHLFLSGASIKKKAIVFGLLAAGLGTVGTYLFLKGAKEYSPSVECCCAENGEDSGFEFEDIDELDELDCSIVADGDVVEDIEAF